MKYAHLVLVITLTTSEILAGELPVVPLVNIDPQQLNPTMTTAGILPAADESRGWAFELATGKQLEYLAWYDTDGDGLSHSHRVGIWRNTLAGFSPGMGHYFPYFTANELVTEIVIPTGSQAELAGPWRRIPVGPIVLKPGQYQIVGENHAGSDDGLVFWLGLDHRPLAQGASLVGISIGQPIFGPIKEGNWFPPLLIPLDVSPFTTTGPMLFVRDVPEPSTWATALVGVCGWWICRWYCGRVWPRRSY